MALMTKVTLYLALWFVKHLMLIRNQGCRNLDDKHDKYISIYKQYYTFTIQWELCCWFVSCGAPLIYRAWYTLGWLGWFCCCFYIHYVHIFSTCTTCLRWWSVSLLLNFTIHSTYNSCVYTDTAKCNVTTSIIAGRLWRSPDVHHTSSHIVV